MSWIQEGYMGEVGVRKEGEEMVLKDRIHVPAFGTKFCLTFPHLNPPCMWATLINKESSSWLEKGSWSSPGWCNSKGHITYVINIAHSDVLLRTNLMEGCNYTHILISSGSESPHPHRYLWYIFRCRIASCITLNDVSRRQGTPIVCSLFNRNGNG